MAMSSASWIGIFFGAFTPILIVLLRNKRKDK
jgi:hypothetical protein